MGCKNCEYAPTTYEEYFMCKRCPDAFTKNAKNCNNYNEELGGGRMSLTVTSEDIKKLKKKLGYKGCRNCENKIEPLRMCEWAERGGDGALHLLCPKWEKKERKGEKDG